MLAAVGRFLRRVVEESAHLFWVLVKIMLPVMLAVRLAVLAGAIEPLSALFAPLMELVGLPAATGLVWATACLVNIYGGAAALIGVLPGLEAAGTPLSVAQMTVLTSMILIAHGLPIEQRVCQKAGAGLVYTTALRMGAALAYGALLNALYGGAGWLGEPVHIAWLPATAADAGWLAWAEDTAWSLASIFAIIVALVFVLRLMDVLKITALLSRLLAPVLRLMGIGPAAVPLTMVGTLLGLSYGGGLIIREARAGTLAPRDVVLAVSFMAICHSLIEDTLFMMALGGHWSGVLVGRFLFSVALMAVIARVVHALPDAVFHRWLATGPRPLPAQ